MYIGAVLFVLNFCDGFVNTILAVCSRASIEMLSSLFSHVHLQRKKRELPPKSCYCRQLMKYSEILVSLKGMNGVKFKKFS